ncbi:MAG: hypothetical protein VXZ53_00530, partial [Planctomycetota bacterium]|nr:hypothetical protein [Planctomycetota bacterium]
LSRDRSDSDRHPYLCPAHGRQAQPASAENFAMTVFLFNPTLSIENCATMTCLDFLNSKN